jgi:hypothetical protein
MEMALRRCQQTANLRTGVGDMKRTKMVKSFFILIILMWSSAFGVDIGSVIKGNEEILHVGRFGRGTPVVISNGYLFIDFKYIPIPYVIERVGQAVTVNNIIVNCLYTNALPETFERVASECRGSDGRMHTIIAPPHPASWLKGTADAHVSKLSNDLNFAAVFLPGARTPLLESKCPSIWKPRNMPVSAKIALEEFPRALLAAVSEETPSNVWKSVKTSCARWSLTEKDTKRLVEQAKVSTNLIERLKKEITALDEPKVPSYAILSTDLAVGGISKHELKLDVVFENGMKPSINDDWIIEDIQFETNATRVVATRLGHPPLPKTKSIRSQSRLTATIISLHTGEIVSSAITDKPESAIQLNGIKYQVVDIRPSAKAVLLKDCKTGQRIFVTFQKGK